MARPSSGRSALKVVSRQEERRQQSAARFQFHESVLRDGSLSLTAVRLAGYIMHRFETKDGVGFSLSIRSAARFLKTDRRNLQRACRELEERGHLQRTSSDHNRPGQWNGKSRFAFCLPPAVHQPPGGGAPTAGDGGPPAAAISV
jgi:DNA-binding MarR family transcriptional regulator